MTRRTIPAAAALSLLLSPHPCALCAETTPPDLLTGTPTVLQVSSAPALHIASLAPAVHALATPSTPQADTTTVFPFVNIAASGRGTMIRIDVNTGEILGEYVTSPAGMGRNPSRTTVDLFGNVWVANRDEIGESGGEEKGSLTRIGIVVGGRRADAEGAPDPTGGYLEGPFQHSTCVDRDLDGLIHTSRGLGDTIPWTNAGGADTHGGVSTAGDECIINYTRVAGTGTRTIAVDAANDLWVGGLTNREHEKLSGVTGEPIPGTRFNLGCGGYGGLIDRNGILWSAGRAAGLLVYDTEARTGECLDRTAGDYGLGLDVGTGEIWHTYLNGNMVAKLGPDGSVRGRYSHGGFNAQGVVVDNAGNVWVAHSLLSGYTTVGHLRTNGTFVGYVSLPEGSGPTGVAVDANGNVWVANYFTNNVMRINPNLGPVGGGGFRVGEVDLTVDLGEGAEPYNYSDMTGFVAFETLRRGFLRVVATGAELILGQSAREIELIFDSSGSMWGKIEGRTKIAIAKEVMSETIESLPDDLRVALRVFGHRIEPGEAGACQDSELVYPLADIDKPLLLERIASVEARGTTPIAHSLRQVADDLSDEPGEKLVILVTDGEEECRGDPPAVVEELLEQGLEVRVNIVGFALADEQTRADMRQITDLTAGRFFNAADREELLASVTTALAVPFDILDAAGIRVGGGLVGDEAIELPAGSYSIVVRTAGGEVTVPGISVAQESTTGVELFREGAEIGHRIVEP